MTRIMDPLNLKPALYTAAAVLLVLLGAYKAGSRAARRAEELKRLRQTAASTRKAHEITQTLDALDDDAIRRRADRWVRKPDQ